MANVVPLPFSYGFPLFLAGTTFRHENILVTLFPASTFGCDQNGVDNCFLLHFAGKLGRYRVSDLSLSHRKSGFDPFGDRKSALNFNRQDNSAPRAGNEELANARKEKDLKLRRGSRDDSKEVLEASSAREIRMKNLPGKAGRELKVEGFVKVSSRNAGARKENNRSHTAQPGKFRQEREVGGEADCNFETNVGDGRANMVAMGAIPLSNYRGTSRSEGVVEGRNEFRLFGEGKYLRGTWSKEIARTLYKRADSPVKTKSSRIFIEKAQDIIDSASADKTGESSERKTQEKKWLRLLSSVQESKLSKLERPDLILQLLDMMYDSGVSVNAMHICAAVTVCINADAMGVAEQIVDNARSKGNTALINAFVFAKLIQGYCSLDQRREAFALLAVMDKEGVKHDVVMYNTLLETEQSPEGVDFLVQELGKRGIQPDERTYRCHGRAGQLGVVRRLWQQMTTEGVAPSVFTFNSLLDAYANVGDVEACKKIVDEMELKGLTLPRDSYNTLLKAHGRCRDADGAVGVLRKMQRKGVRPCIITYNTVMDACIRGRAMQRALSLAMELRLHHLKPDPVTFATMLRAAGLLRDTAMVHKVLQDMETAQCTLDEVMYRCAVYAYVHCGEGGAAVEILERMNDAGFTPAMTVPEVLTKSVDAALLRGCTAAAPAGRLHQFLADMAAAGLSPTGESGGAIVRKLAHSHGVKVSLDVAREFHRLGITSLGLYTWQSVIGASATRPNQNPLLAAAEVSRILDTMEADATSPDRIIYETAISIYVRCGDGERAIDVYQRMQKANLLPNAAEGSRDPLERMLLDTLDAALVGGFAADLGNTGGERHALESSESGSQQTPLSETTIMQDLADVGILVKPGAVTSAIHQLCVDVSPQMQGFQEKGLLTLRKPTLGSQPLQETSELTLQDPRVQRLKRAMQLVETSACLFGMQLTSFVYGALMEACIQLEQVEQVECLWERLRSEGVTPDAGTWVLRIRALSGIGSIKGRTHQLLAEAADDRLELDSRLLRALLKACHQVKDVTGVSHVRRMLETSHRTQSSVKLVKVQDTGTTTNL